MNRKVNRIITIIVWTAFICWTGDTLAQTEEQIEKFCQEREVFFNERLNLTEAEAKAFWPLYNDFSNRKMKINDDEMNTFRYSHMNADNLSDQEVIKNLEKIHQLKTELFNLEREYYHEKFPEVLPPKKVMLLYKVEWDFRHHLINRIREHGPDGREGPEGASPDDRPRSKGRSWQGQEPTIPPQVY